jgi:hypothetical protein
MPVPDAHLLFAMGRADARIHVEHDALRRTAGVNAVDPLTGKIGERGQVLFGREAARLETPHLARRRCTSRGRFAADDPTHCRIMARPFCVVDVLVSGQPSENGLPQHAHERVSAVLSGPGIREPFASHRAEAQRIIEFTVSEQTGVRRNGRAAKLKHQLAVEIEPQHLATRFIRWVHHAVSFRISLTR